MALSPTVKLNNGVEIPLIGLGTWKSEPQEVITAVEYAIKEAGYRHIDCAWGYGNEKEVGEGIRRSGVPRSELFLTSKLWAIHMHDVDRALNETLTNLGVDYLDLYLIHWPVALNPNGNNAFIPTLPNGHRDVLRDWPLRDTWRQMEAALAAGKVRAIGVSNCSQRLLEEQLLPHAAVVPAVDQVELHPYCPQHEFVAYLRTQGILAQAYSPLGSTGSPLIQDAVAGEIAAKHGLNPADVLLGWHVAKGIVVLPKSVTPARIKANIEGAVAAAKKLTPEDIARIDGIAASGKNVRYTQPPWGVDFGFENWPVKYQT